MCCIIVSLFCSAFPPVATSLTMTTTEKTSMTGKRKDGVWGASSILLPPWVCWAGTHGPLAPVFPAINRRLIMLTSERPKAEICWETQREFSTSSSSCNNWENVVLKAVFYYRTQKSRKKENINKATVLEQDHSDYSRQRYLFRQIQDMLSRKEADFWHQDRRKQVMTIDQVHQVNLTKGLQILQLNLLFAHVFIHKGQKKEQ